MINIIWNNNYYFMIINDVFISNFFVKHWQSNCIAIYDKMKKLNSISGIKQW